MDSRVEVAAVAAAGQAVDGNSLERMKHFLTSSEEQEVVQAIHDAELRTTGEIRVIITSKWIFRLQHYAWKAFHRLGMTNTAARNGALIVVMARRRRFVVIGDQGLAEKVEPSYWENIASIMSAKLKDGQRSDALISAINLLTETLAQHWPADGKNPDELPNEIAYD